MSVHGDSVQDESVINGEPDKAIQKNDSSGQKIDCRLQSAKCKFKNEPPHCMRKGLTGGTGASGACFIFFLTFLPSYSWLLICV